VGRENLLLGETTEQLYVALIMQDWSTELAEYAVDTCGTGKDALNADVEQACKDLVRGELQDHVWDEELCEAIIIGANIVVNLWEWVRTEPWTLVKDLHQKLFWKMGGSYYTRTMAARSLRLKRVKVRSVDQFFTVSMSQMADSESGSKEEYVPWKFVEFGEAEALRRTQQLA
jgi:hypothetical protein